MRLAFSTIEPDRRCTQFCTIVRGDHRVAGSLAASATSTSPLGSTMQPARMLEALGEGSNLQPGAGFGVAPSGHGSFATDHLMVGIALSFASGRRGSGP